jgi:transcriptional regulator with XRE-family HTH domain
MHTIRDVILKANRLGIKDIAIARRLGVTRAAVSRWRHNQREPDVQYLEPLARLAEVPMRDVMLAAIATRALIRTPDAWERTFRAMVTPDMHYTTREVPAPATRWLRQLSGWLKNHQPALQTYAIWRIQKLSTRTLRRLCAWPRGYSTSRRAASPGASWPMPAWGLA